MPWFPALPFDSDLSPLLTRDTQHTLPFYQGILDLSPDALLASWSAEPRVDDPRVGLVTGAADFGDYVRTTREWLTLGDATARTAHVLNGVIGSVEEVTVELEVGGERHELAVAVVAERDAEQLLTSIRIYHSLWPLFPNRPMHVPSIPVHGAVNLPVAVRENLRARAAEDTEAILETYSADAVVQTSTNGLRTFSGTDELRRLYAGPSVPGMKPTMKVCGAVDDETACAVEYQVTHFSVPAPDQVGLVVYELDPTGRIARERGYVVAHQHLSASTEFPAVDPGGNGLSWRAHHALVPRDSDTLQVLGD